MGYHCAICGADCFDGCDCQPPIPQPSPSPSVPDSILNPAPESENASGNASVAGKESILKAEREAKRYAHTRVGTVTSIEELSDAHLAGQAVGEKRETNWWAAQNSRVSKELHAAEARIAELERREREAIADCMRLSEKASTLERELGEAREQWQGALNREKAFQESSIRRGNDLDALRSRLESVLEVLEFYSQPGMALDPSDIEYSHSESGFTAPHSGKRARAAMLAVRAALQGAAPSEGGSG